MPRAARKKSKTGIYHIMIQGINQELIFEDDQDNRKFLDILADCKQEDRFQLYAYCLMGNHAHLLIKEGYERLGQIFKRVGATYVQWFNRKYNRTGPLFHDRFKSEPVEDYQTLFAVIRFIHQNPVKAQLASSVDTYKRSSFKDYAGRSKLTNTSFALKKMTRENFIDFNRREDSDSCLDIAPAWMRGKDATEGTVGKA